MIYVKLFGTPTIKKDEETIFLPFRKAEALFYYLVVNRQATRDELVSLLWGDIEEETARKNLRHAMYKIRKVFDEDIIISPQKSIVMLNPEIDLESDLKVFLEDEEKSTEVYTGEFLQGFLVKDAQAFEDWMFQIRDSYKGLYSTKLYQRMIQFIEAEEDDKVEEYARRLIQADIFDERGYRALMRLYNKQGSKTKAMEVYHKLWELLEEELGITPDHKTKELYKEIELQQDEEDSSDKDHLKNFFYGRIRETQLIKHHFKAFINNKPFSSIIITGEAGIGKTCLKDRCLRMFKEEDFYLLQSSCYQAEEEYFLKPWNPIFTVISKIIKEEDIPIPTLWRDILSSIFPAFASENTSFHVNMVEEMNQYKYRVVEEAVIGLFQRMSQRKKILLVFEDLQWIDAMSLSLLSSILLQDHNNSIFFIGTCRDNYVSKIDMFMTKMKKYDLLEEIYLPRFLISEVEDFIHKALPTLKIDQGMLKEIYKETEGNTFFIMEYLNSIGREKSFKKITPKMEDVLKSRFLDVSREGKKLLNIISLFFDKAPLDILQVLMNKDPLEVMDIAEDLYNRKIITEIEGAGEIGFQFTHSKLREYIYMQQSSAMRRVLHSKVAQVLEKELKNEKVDKLLYPKLIYHYYNAGDKLKTLKYTIKNLDAYMDFTHELFPVSNDPFIQGDENYFMVEKELTRHLLVLENQLENLMKESSAPQEMIRLQIELFHMMGRYFIAEGEYEKGVSYIKKMLKASEDINAYEFMVKGYRQLIYYCIQVHGAEEMKIYVEKALKIAKEEGFRKEEGILLRLKGLNKIMMAKYEEAEDLLRLSIKIFEEICRLDDRYLLNIAAAYHYIGEIRRYNMKFSNALSYYDKAISICEERKIVKGLTIFYTHAGQAAFDMGDYYRAKGYFQKAIDYYEQLEVLWGRAIADGYMALLLVREGHFREGLELLKKAETYGKKIKNPYELGLLYRIMAEIKSMMENNNDLFKVFHSYLNLGLEEYCRRGISFLEEVKDSYEKEILKIFLLYSTKK